MTPDSVASTVERWILVDLDRILRLPDRLRRLWPPELLPHRQKTAPSRTEDEDADRDSASAGDPNAAGTPAGNQTPDVTSAGDTSAGLASAGGEGGGVTETERELDVLTAWLCGFAAELDRASTRITVVLSSGIECVHLALCLGPGAGHGVAALQGEGFEDFAGHQLLRRIGPGQVGRVVEELAELVEHDCVLTLSWAVTGGAAGMEFLHRRGGTWFRPVLEWRGDSVTVDADVEAEDAAVRRLLGAVLTRTLTMGVR